MEITEKKVKKIFKLNQTETNTHTQTQQRVGKRKLLLFHWQHKTQA